MAMHTHGALQQCAFHINNAQGWYLDSKRNCILHCSPATTYCHLLLLLPLLPALLLRRCFCFAPAAAPAAPAAAVVCS
jgi:hypothetical protein